MATAKQTIKNWFKTGLFPTQAQFWATWDSFWHKDETIPQSKITNLTNVLNAKAEKAQFDAHLADENAHQALFALKADKADLEGLSLAANQATAEIYLKDSEGNTMATINVGFLNNEGTTFFYNEATEKLELQDDDGDVLSEIPVSAFVANLVSAAAFNGTSLEFKDSEGNVQYSVPFTIANISGLQAALNAAGPQNLQSVLDQGVTASITTNFSITGSGQKKLQCTNAVVDVSAASVKLAIGSGTGVEVSGTQSSLAVKIKAVNNYVTFDSNYGFKWLQLQVVNNSTNKILAHGSDGVMRMMNIGGANGITQLDAGGKIPAALLPSTVMDLQGGWDASTNNPALLNGTGNSGDVWECTVAGTVNFGAGNIHFNVGDWAVYGAGGIWYKSVNTNEVTSVNGKVGTVVIDIEDIAGLQSTLDKKIALSEESEINIKNIAVVAELPEEETAGTLYFRTDDSIEYYGEYSTEAPGGLIVSIPHGLDAYPSWVDARPASPEAIGPYWISYDMTNITLTYLDPPSGTLKYFIAFRS